MTLIMNLDEYVFGWASRVFPGDLVGHENTRRFHLRMSKQLRLSLRYTLASHICSFVICIAFTLLMAIFHFVPFSQQMRPPENYYYTPWAVGFQYGCNNITITFLAPLFLLSFIFGFKRSKVFWFVLLPLGIACVPSEALLGYYNYQFWAHRIQLYSFYVASVVVFLLIGVWVACHFRASRWIIWDFLKVGGTIVAGLYIFNNCILPAFGIGFAPKVRGIPLTPFTPDSNTPKWKTLLFRILGVPAFMQLTFFLMRHSAISSKVAAPERSHVYWCWGHAMNNIYLRLIAFELNTLEIVISSSADMLFQIALTLLFVMPIEKTLKNLFACCINRPTRHGKQSGENCDSEEQDERNALMKDSDEHYKSEEVVKKYGTFSSGTRNLNRMPLGVPKKEDESDTRNLLREKINHVNSNGCQNICKIDVDPHDLGQNIEANKNRLTKIHHDDIMFKQRDEKFSYSYDGSIQERKHPSDALQQNNCRTRAYSYACQRDFHGKRCTEHNVVAGLSVSSSATARLSDVEARINSKKQKNRAVHLTTPAGESTLRSHDDTENDSDNGTVSDRKKAIIEIFFHSNTVSKMVGIVSSVVIYTFMYRHRYVYDIGYVNQAGGVDAPIQITQILACVCIPLVLEVIGDIISNMIMLTFGWFSVIPIWAEHGFRIVCVVGVSFLVMLPCILHGFIALPMADSCQTLNVCSCQHIFEWLVDKCNRTSSTAMQIFRMNLGL